MAEGHHDSLLALGQALRVEVEALLAGYVQGWASPAARPADWRELALLEAGLGALSGLTDELVALERALSVTPYSGARPVRVADGLSEVAGPERSSRAQPAPPSSDGAWQVDQPPPRRVLRSSTLAGPPAQGVGVPGDVPRGPAPLPTAFGAPESTSGSAISPAPPAPETALPQRSAQPAADAWAAPRVRGLADFAGVLRQQGGLALAEDARAGAEVAPGHADGRDAGVLAQLEAPAGWEREAPAPAEPAPSRSPLAARLLEQAGEDRPVAEAPGRPAPAKGFVAPTASQPPERDPREARAQNRSALRFPDPLRVGQVEPASSEGVAPLAQPLAALPHGLGEAGAFPFSGPPPVADAPASPHGQLASRLTPAPAPAPPSLPAPEIPVQQPLAPERAAGPAVAPGGDWREPAAAGSALLDAEQLFRLLGDELRRQYRRYYEG